MKTLLICAVLLALPWIALATPVPDTGQTKCYDNTQEISCPNPGEDFYGQDAQYITNPHSYTKLDENGNDLPDGATEWVMVRDDLTGLIWEVKTDDASIHDKDITYNWYDAQNVFISTVNVQNYGGYNDWHLPTIKELCSLVDWNQLGPAINTSFFPNTAPTGYYWSDTTFAGNPDLAWLVTFGIGGASPIYKPLNPSYVRAVRGGQSSNNFIDNLDGTITDINTNLMWQKDAGMPCLWQQALSYCENLSLAGYDDWRLPNANEQQSIIDYSRYAPSIDPIFMDTVTSCYWTSTSDSWDAFYAVVIHSYDGEVAFNNGKFSPCNVRPVRGGCIDDCDSIPDSEDNCPYNCNPLQEDTYPPQGNGIGDACDCEGNFNCAADSDVDGSDAALFKGDFGRSSIEHPCIAGDTCNGDFSCDGDVDGTDASLFKSDFGRSSMLNPCLVCVVGEWCSYPLP